MAMRGWAGALALMLSAGVLAEDERSSPDWRDQIIYFLMIDRFNDGDPSNNDQGAGEFDPADHRRYSGGDLAGIQRRLDYIQGLGVTGIWITPPVAHQWWDGSRGYGGYHGYWGEHFLEVDRHFGSLEDYQSLARALHRRGMTLTQDIVVNHVGNYFEYHGGHDPDDPSRYFRLNPDPRPSPAPRQWPFSLNDVRDPAHRQADIFHWTPEISDFNDRQQELLYQLADLDDLNTENPVVRTALRQSYGHWIQEVGVDAYRVDTALHVPRELLIDLLHADDPEAPGLLAAARASGRDSFHIFGEGFAIDRPFEDHQARRIEEYQRAEQGPPPLPAMINFPLYGSLGDVIARGHPTSVLAHRIRSMMALHEPVHLMPTFLDNHDVDRFLAGASEAALRQGLLALMTLPGIPVIYYGTEQGFRERRQAMFASGYRSGGRDHFDTEAPLYRFLQEVIALRRAQPALRRGQPEVIYENAARAGALAWWMRHSSGDLLVILNTADSPALLAGMDSGLGANHLFESLLSLDGAQNPLRSDHDGRISLQLAPRSAQVWRAIGVAATPEPPPNPVTIRLDPLPETARSDFSLSGQAEGTDGLQLVLDGDLSTATPIEVGEDGQFSVRVDTGALIDPDTEHQVLVWSEAAGVASNRLRFRVQPEWRLAAEISDPAGDDHGPEGRYRYPTDPSWGPNRQLDLLGARAYTSGGALRLQLDLRQVSASWNPPQGFDHVAFTMFIQLPGRSDGERVMPLQNASLPGDLRWHYRLRVGGWSNALFSAEGASATAEGRPVTPGASVQVDRLAKQIQFTLPAAALGRPLSLSGARIYITTWDQDGDYRSLQPEAGSHAFGGGDGRVDPLVMDDLLLELP